MSVRDVIQAAAGASTTADKTYIEDVFSTYLYTGTGAAQTITNGIDLAGKGGMVWLKGRSGATDHALYDTARGATYDLGSNLLTGQTTQTTGLTSFNPNGFSIGALAKINTSAATYASWTFRKAPKFFDVVTYTGNGSTNRQISHSLGQAPGMVIVKQTDASNNWTVWHRSTPVANARLFLNLTNAASSTASSDWGGSSGVFSSSVFTVGTNIEGGTGGLSNGLGYTYVAYLFAHDTSIDGLIQCGSYTGTGAVGNTINLGWEPQYLLVKCTSLSGANWYVLDNMRQFGETASPPLYPNATTAEVSADNISAVSNGFSVHAIGSAFNSNGATYIYMAIRRGPMRTPTDATKVFSTIARTGTGANAAVSPGFVTDMVIEGNRTSTTAGDKFGAWDRLRGTNYLITNSTAAEVAAATTIIQANPWDVMDGYKVGTTSSLTNASGSTFVNWMFKRAPGFFDVVCFTSSASRATINHNLGAPAELAIFKSRSASGSWPVLGTALGSNRLVLNTTTFAASQYNFTSDASSFSVDSFGTAGITYVAYLFASCPEVSKVGSYTGNGSSQTINCGFANGARFILIKRTDSTGGDWYVWDTARGIVAAQDPRLSLNVTAFEVTTDDTIDPNSTGFIVNQVSATNVNVSTATYLYLAIA